MNADFWDMGMPHRYDGGGNGLFQSILFRSWNGLPVQDLPRPLAMIIKVANTERQSSSKIDYFVIQMWYYIECK